MAGPLAAVSTDTGDCACPAADAAPGLCSSAGTARLIVDFVQAARKVPGPLPATAAVKAAAQLLDCGSEACVVEHPDLLQYVRQRAGPQAATALAAEAAQRFKERGPRNSTALLSNFNIDGVLRRWAEEFPRFFCCAFAMMDFAEAGGYELARVSLPHVRQGRATQQSLQGKPLRRPCDTFACVLNTDVSSGQGKHWVCLLVDMRPPAEPWTVEYFNSAGNPPPRAVTRWCETTADELREHRGAAGEVRTLAVTDVAHQKSRTECGLYALFYIRARLEGRPASFFAKEKVPDAAMTEFRKHVFRE